jgi:hypothetical protein
MAPPSAIAVGGIRDTEGIPLPDPLTANGVSARRAKAGKLVAGTAAYTSSDFFKSPVSRATLFPPHLLSSIEYWQTKGEEMGP